MHVCIHADGGHKQIAQLRTQFKHIPKSIIWFSISDHDSEASETMIYIYIFDYTAYDFK